jgi:hypothetical protein
MQRKRTCLNILARQGGLTENEWLDLLEIRREDIRPHLHDMSLRALGDLGVVNDDRGRYPGRPLRKGGMRRMLELEGGDYHEPSELDFLDRDDSSLELRGIFPDDRDAHSFHVEFAKGKEPPTFDSVIRFWALTRSNEWILVEIEERSFVQPKTPGRDRTQERRTEIVGLHVTQKTPQEICIACNTTLAKMWYELGKFVGKWAEQRRLLFSTAQDLSLRFDMEKLIVGVIK